MDCKFAYAKNGIDYVLCKKEKAPNPQDTASVAHAACLHQKWCPHKGCHRLDENWAKCFKLAQETVKRFDEAVPVEESFIPATAPRKRTVKKKTEAK